MSLIWDDDFNMKPEAKKFTECEGVPNSYASLISTDISFRPRCIVLTLDTKQSELL
jgi:hypothetical protein